MEKEITEQIKTSIDYLSNLVLESSGTHRDYSDEDLANAMVILQEVFLAKMYDFHENKLPPQGLELQELAKEAGKSLRQTVLLFTGVDLHKVYSPKEK